MAKQIISVEFEVFGRVQGVFFRKYTQEQGTRLGLRGWCKNTDAGTVVGIMEGETKPIETMKIWLQQTGSPQSQIEKTVFTNEKKLEDYKFKNFSIHK